MSTQAQVTRAKPSAEGARVRAARRLGNGVARERRRPLSELRTGTALSGSCCPLGVLGNPHGSAPNARRRRLSLADSHERRSREVLVQSSILHAKLLVQALHQ
ncbi:hypothetical protein NDU88_002477 [Pleurodeles waltl]|uniref:Uncharacterized protein n=1 Tax=Pleurodeles waltl TaxID=8319 RepID=A0AAV7NM49_PLEWA|nr:hypothetical protein NDU88_002477 [Pleurodeles waltl]